VIRQAWSEVDGPFWREFGQRPGAVKELTKVIDRITQNRTRFTLAEDELGTPELAKLTAAQRETVCGWLEGYLGVTWAARDPNLPWWSVN
jgi:hypothetical protein